MVILKPFRIILHIKPLFFIYIVTSILVGQLGILFSFFEDKLSIYQILIVNLENGNLYVFSIALLASSIAPVFIEYIAGEEILYKVYKIVTTITMIFILIIPMTYLSSLNFRSMVNINITELQNKSLDWVQILFYVLSILISIYMYCLFYIKYDSESYAELEDQNILNLKKSTQNVKSDSKGNKL